MSTNVNIRSVLELLCTILSENDVISNFSSGSLKAEILRQAKFNEDRVTELIWKAFFDVTRYYDMQSTAEASAPRGNNMSSEEIVCSVKYRLQNLGFLSKSFAELPNDGSSGSRLVLLGLGWFIHTAKIFDKIIAKRTSPIHNGIMKFVTNPDLSSLMPSPWKTPSRCMSDKQRLQRQLMMCGKLRMSLRRLYASLQQSAKIKQQIRHYTTGTNLQPDLDHLTPLETYLLRYPSSMKEMHNELVNDNFQLKNLIDWKEKEHMFWDWMEHFLEITIMRTLSKNEVGRAKEIDSKATRKQKGVKPPQEKDSVLSLHITEVKDHEKPEQESSLCESVYLLMPPSIADDISHTRSKLREFILEYEEDMFNLDQILSSKKVSSDTLAIVSHNSGKELAELSKSLGESPLLHKDERQVSCLSPPKDISCNKRYQAHQSTENRKRNEKAEILKTVKEETQILQDKILLLETKLKETQLYNVHKLKGLIESDEHSICILPRYFKQFSCD